MRREAFVRKVEELLEAETGKFSEDTLLSSIEHWDSLAVVGFMAMVDETLNMIPSPEAITNAKTIRDLVNICADKLDD